MKECKLIFCLLFLGEEVLSYDKGDRVERVASKSEDFKVKYDAISGCVSSIRSQKSSRHFWHDARGKLVQMTSIDLSGGGQQHGASR